MPKVFLSRTITSDSPFRNLINDGEWEVHAWSLLYFQRIPIGIPRAVDWLFFYSKKGVQFLLEQYSIPHGLPIAAMGPATAAALKRAGLKPDFVGTGEPKNVAEAFLIKAEGQRVGFVQARQSRQSVQHILKNKVHCSSWVVYDNQIHRTQVKRIPTVDYLIFTSPLNVKAWREQQSAISTCRFIAIGPTTGKALEQAGVKNYRMPSSPNEGALFHCLKNWEKESPTSA